jgi:hypothetical protein
MNDTMIRHEAIYSSDSCPTCGQPSDVVATIHSSNGKWERHFLQCNRCAKSFPGAWANTHHWPATVPLPNYAV